MEEAGEIGERRRIRRRRHKRGPTRYIDAKSARRFNVERVTSSFTDPATGRVIGKRQRTVGSVQVTGVEPEMAFGRYSPKSDDRPQRGDVVTLGNN